MDGSLGDLEQALALGGLQAVFDSNIIGIAISDPDGRVVAANDSYLATLGFTRADLAAGRVDWRVVTPPEHADVDARALAEYAELGKSSVYEKAYVHGDGRRVPVVLASARIPATGGMATFVLDISGQKSAEDALRRSEERYRELFDAATDATFVIDRDTLRILDANRMATTVYGFSHEELLERTSPDLSAEPDATIAFIRAVMEHDGGEPHVGERLHRRKDGAVFPVEFTARVLVRDGRDVILVNSRDLSERRAAEEAVRQRALILNVAPFGFTVRAADGHLLFANPRAAAMHGYTVDELLAAPPAALEAPEGSAGFADRIREAIEHGSTTFETVHVRKDGSLLPVEVTLVRTLWDDAEALLAIALDISDRRRAQQALLESKTELEEAQRVALVGSFTWDRASGALSWSTELHRIFGLAPAGTPATIEAAAALYGPETEARHGDAVARAVADGEPYELDAAITLPDGRTRHVVERAEVVRDGGGRVTGLRGTVADVTELRQAQAVVDQAQRAEMVGRLAGGVAHDFNNLLTAIGGHAEFINDTLGPDDPRRPDVTSILDAAARAADLTRQLLAVGRREVLNPSVIVPGDLVDRLRPMLRSLVPADVELVVRLDPDRTPVRVDRDRLGNAIINLVLNARDAMAGGGTLTIATDAVRLEDGDDRLRGGAVPGEYVRLSVGDTGQGIPDDLLPHIFEPFFTTKSLARGSGLGLPSVEGFLAQSGGWVTVDTAISAGSVFALYLAAAEPEGGPRPSGARVASAGGGERILLVDDESAVRAITARLLRQLGYVVIEAADGDEAVAVCRRESFDALLTDVVLPGLSGPDLAARCQAVHPGLPVLLMSGYARESLLDEGRSIAGSAFLAKPFTVEVLGRSLRDLLDARA
jgi:two-component system cell cycle sensor histidine kinase/response regulator CckA